MHRTLHHAMFERDVFRHQLGGEIFQLIERRGLGRFFCAFREVLTDQVHAVTRYYRHDVKRAARHPAQIGGGGQGFFPR